MKKLLYAVVLSIGTVYASQAVNPKIAFTKQDIDNNLAKIETYAKNGKSKKFPSACAKFDSSLVKYTYKDAPKEIYDYYDHATNICRGKLHLMALETQIKKEGKSQCKAMEVTLQINHIKSFLKKTNDMPLWDTFMLKYKETCPNNLNF